MEKDNVECPGRLTFSGFIQRKKDHPETYQAVQVHVIDVITFLHKKNTGISQEQNYRRKTVLKIEGHSPAGKDCKSKMDQHTRFIPGLHPWKEEVGEMHFSLGKDTQLSDDDFVNKFLRKKNSGENPEVDKYCGINGAIKKLHHQSFISKKKES